jgi:hypothetical protein
MSPPRRRRRRRGRGEQAEAPAQRAEGQAQKESAREQAPRSRSRSRRKGRGGARRESSSPFLSEDLVRALPKERPASLTGPPDGQTLEALIGDLQSEWGVPQYPQEYRITIKVADERDARAERPVAVAAEPNGKSQQTSDTPAAPKRERAPAAPRVVASGEREAAPKRRRGRRRRRKGREGTDGAPAGPPTQEVAPAAGSDSSVEPAGGSLPEG